MAPRAVWRGPGGLPGGPREGARGRGALVRGTLEGWGALVGGTLVRRGALVRGILGEWQLEGVTFRLLDTGLVLSVSRAGGRHDSIPQGSAGDDTGVGQDTLVGRRGPGDTAVGRYRKGSAGEDIEVGDKALNDTFVEANSVEQVTV